MSLMNAKFAYPPRLVAFLVVAAALLAVSPSAHAQDCGAADADIFRAARRSRAIVSDYNTLHDMHRDDLRRNEDFARRTHQKVPWRFDLAGVIALRETLGFDVCTNKGRWDASLTPFMAGGFLSFDENEWGVGFELFALQSSLVLSAVPTDAQQLAQQDPNNTDTIHMASVSDGESMVGGRLVLQEWASVVFGYINTIPVSANAGSDGRVIKTGPGTTSHDRVYLGLASPYGESSFNLVFDPQDVGTDVAELRFAGLPFPADLAKGVVGVSYIDDEKEPVLELGAAEAFDFLSLTTATEFNPLRLRELDARVYWDGGPEMILHSGDDALRLAVNLGAFAQVSYFNSRHLEEQTGRSDVWGIAFGGYARPDVTILMTRFDVWFGVNRPDEIARISDFVGHWQVGMRFHMRLGL